MVVLTRRVALVLTLVVMFVAMQTGWACAYADDRAEEASQACSDEHDDQDDHDDQAAPCGPACSDCVGCSGPARALLAEQRWSPMASCMTVALDTRVVELAPEAQHQRIDRPPRA